MNHSAFGAKLISGARCPSPLDLSNANRNYKLALSDACRDGKGSFAYKAAWGELNKLLRLMCAHNACAVSGLPPGQWNQAANCYGQQNVARAQLDRDLMACWGAGITVAPTPAAVQPTRISTRLGRRVSPAMQGLGRVPAYTDISHFRAPYKNAYIAGFGENSMHGYGYHGYGQDPAPPPPPSPPPPAPNGNMTTNGAPVSPYVVRDQRGYYLVKPEVQGQLMKTLATYSTVFLGGETNRHIIKPFDPALLSATDETSKMIVASTNAAKWIKDQVAAGQVVFGVQQLLTNVLTGMPAPDDISELSTRPVGSQEAKITAALPYVVVFAGDPDKKVAAPGDDWMAKLGGPIGIAVIAGVAVGGIYLLTRKKKTY